MDQLKRQRTSAKSRFTRTVNVLLSKLEDDTVSDDSLITSIFNDVRDAWRNVNEKHDAYVVALPDDQPSREDDEWINGIQNKLYEVQGKVNATLAKIKNKLVLESATHNRGIAYTNFCQLCLKLEKTLAMNIQIESIERERNIIQAQFTEVKMKHNELLVIVDVETTEHQEWLSKLTKDYLAET